MYEKASMEILESLTIIVSLRVVRLPSRFTSLHARVIPYQLPVGEIKLETVHS